MSKPKNFSEDERAAIALKALIGGEQAIKNLAEEHNVTEDEIKDWIRDTGVASEVDPDDVSLEVSEEFYNSVELGVTHDKLNYKRLVFWSVFGTLVIIILTVSVILMHDFTRVNVIQQSAQESKFHSIQRIQEETQATLNSFELVDPEEGIYRIPIDSAITIIATD